MGNFVNNITDLYREYRPAYNNLYEVTFFDLDPANEPIKNEINSHFVLHALKIEFAGEELKLKRNPITKRFQVNNSDIYQRADELKITIRESDDWKIKRFHENWISKIYDKENDYFISRDIDGSKFSIYKNIHIKFPLSNMGITFYNVIPKGFPGINMHWSKSAEIINHQISYYVESWEWDDIESLNIVEDSNKGSDINE